MRAIVVAEHGGPEVLRASEVADPRPGPGEVLVTLAAAGVNYMDIYAREGGGGYARPLPFVPGGEGAGTVSALGAGVREPAVGVVVAWAGPPGGYAEQVVVPAERAVPVPDGVDAETAAAVMLQGLTAHYLSHSTFPLSAGDVALVHAAAGGVGLLLTQLAVARGAVVLATTSSAAKADLARGAGASHVLGYDDFAERARELTGGKGVGVVYDGVGAATFDHSLDSLRPRGMLVLYGAASGPVAPFDPQRLNSGGSLYVTRPTMADYVATREELLARCRDLFDSVRAGSLSVRIGGIYPLAEAGRAHRDLAGRATTGKLLLRP